MQTLGSRRHGEEGQAGGPSPPLPASLILLLHSSSPRSFTSPSPSPFRIERLLDQTQDPPCCSPFSVRRGLPDRKETKSRRMMRRSVPHCSLSFGPVAKICIHVASGAASVLFLIRSIADFFGADYAGPLVYSHNSHHLFFSLAVAAVQCNFLFPFWRGSVR